MGREVRRVPAGWQHPKDASDRYVPLLDGQSVLDGQRQWDAGWLKWQEGLIESYSAEAADDVWGPHNEDWSSQDAYREWAGTRPEQTEVMPAWPAEQCTHVMMYETTTEGTPISPAFATPEELARWLTDNEASASGHMTATYEQWLATCRAGSAPSLVYSPSDGLQSGVAAMGTIDPVKS